MLPGFTARQLLPEHQKQWLSWLAARGVDSGAGYPDIHRPAGTRRERDHQCAAHLFEGRDAGRLPRRRVHPLAVRAGRGAPWFAHISFISPHPPFVVPAPYNTMYDPDDGPDFRRAATKKAEREIHPYVDYELSRSAHRQLRGRRQGQGRRPQRGRVPANPRDLLRHDLRGRRAARPRLGSRQEARRLGRHDRHPDLGSCRDDGRSSHARQRAASSTAATTSR